MSVTRVSNLPDMVRMVPQTGFHPDCGIASLAMLCGVMYEDALAAFADPAEVLQKGVSWPMMKAAALKLGIRTTVKRKYDIHESTGILNVIRPKDEHLVLLWEGRIVEGNGELWKNPEDYLKHYKYTAKGLLVIKGPVNGH